MDLRFTERTLALIQEAARTNEDGLAAIAQAYADKWESIEGAPSPTEITSDDVPCIAAIGSYGEAETSWQSFKARVIAERQRELQAINPYNCRWYAKTEDDRNPWMNECGVLSAGAQADLCHVFTSVSPKLDRPMVELLSSVAPLPERDASTLDIVADSIKRMLPLFVWQQGGDDPDWNAGPSVCLLAGLGFRAFRRIARVLEAQEYNGWDYWARCSDRQLAEDVIKIQQTCGFPVGLLRADYRKVYAVMRGEDPKQHGGADVRWVPRWFIALAALHILKHTRLLQAPGSPPKLFVAYNGHYALLEIPPTGFMQPFASRSNVSLAHDLCHTLQLPYSTAASREWFHEATARALQRMHPSMIPVPGPLTLRTDLLAAPRVVVAGSRLPSRDTEWVNPGVVLTNVAKIDAEGKVHPRSTVAGPDVMAFDWPLAGVASKGDIEAWRQTLPSKIQPMRASSIVLACLRNINDLGHRKGLAAAIDAVVTLDLYREHIQGSPLGHALRSEYPLIFALPMGGDTHDTTNQGKTSLCRLLGGTLVPNIQMTVSNSSPSAPAQRTLSMPIERDGTAILDEFRMPMSAEHFLNHAGLQSLATGGKTSPGRAGENAEAFGLRHPLFLSAKVAPEIPDIVNRSLAIFLDTITPDNSASPELLSDIISGRTGMIARLCHLRWMEQQGILETLKTLPIAIGKWRYNAHLSVANWFAGNDVDATAYILESQEMCRRQVTTAGQTGLADEIGLKRSFDPIYFLEAADPTTLEGLYISYQGEGNPLGLPALDVMNAIISNGDQRHIERTLASNNIRESSAVRKFVRCFQQAPDEAIRVGSYCLSHTMSNDKGSFGTRSFIKVRKLSEDDLDRMIRESTEAVLHDELEQELEKAAYAPVPEAPPPALPPTPPPLPTAE